MPLCFCKTRTRACVAPWKKEQVKLKLQTSHTNGASGVNEGGGKREGEGEHHEIKSWKMCLLATFHGGESCCLARKFKRDPPLHFCLGKPVWPGARQSPHVTIFLSLTFFFFFLICLPIYLTLYLFVYRSHFLLCLALNKPGLGGSQYTGACSCCHL